MALVPLRQWVLPRCFANKRHLQELDAAREEEAAPLTREQALQASLFVTNLYVVEWLGMKAPARVGCCSRGGGGTVVARTGAAGTLHCACALLATRALGCGASQRAEQCE